MGNADDTGLYPNVQKQVDDLMSSGAIPTNARIKLLEDVIELTCQAYLEVSFYPWKITPPVC
jgi:DnaJ family protein C protein 3